MQREILELLQQLNFDEAAAQAEKLSADELALLLQSLNETELASFCRALDSELLAQALLLLDPELQEVILSGLRDDELDAVMEEISVDDTVEIIEDMPQELVRRIAAPVVTKALPSQAVVCSPQPKLLPLLFAPFICHWQRSQTSPCGLRLFAMF